MPYAYAVNKNSGTGTVTDDGGKFSLHMRMGDTLAFSYVGYSVKKVFTHILKDSVKNGNLSVKVFLKSKTNELKTIVISPSGFSKEIKQTYAEKIGEYKRGISSPLANPIDAMYYAWSKKGHELQKLSVLYEQLLIDEIKEARLSPEKVRAITGNDTIDVKDFLNYCFLPEQFILSSSDYDLFFAVKRYYKGYMEIRRRKQ